MSIPTKSINLLMLLCVRGINNMLFMPAWNIHEYGLVNIECHTDVHKPGYCLPIRMLCRCRMMETMWISFWDEDGEGHPGVVSFGFEHGWTKADGWCMVTTGYHRLLPKLWHEDPASYFNCLRMQTKRLQRRGSSVNAQCTCSACAVTTQCTQWKRRESAMRAQTITN